MTEDQRDAIQTLFNEFRQQTGDHKMDFRPFEWERLERRIAFATWIRETVSESVLREIETPTASAAL